MIHIPAESGKNTKNAVKNKRKTVMLTDMMNKTADAD